MELTPINILRDNEKKLAAFHAVQWRNIDSVDYGDLTFDYIFKIDIQNCYEFIADIYKETLSANEIAKAVKFRNIEGFKRYICARYSLRKVLSSFLNISPENIVFKLGLNNKPYVDCIEFNLTHCGDFAVIAVSEIPIGIDLELIKQNFDFNSILPFSFTNRELSFIEKCADACETFYWLWTRKEALLKATGEGLVDQMNEISVLEDKAPRSNYMYNFYSFKISEDYIGCFVSSSTKTIRYINYLY